MIDRIATVGIYVDDQEAALRFWVDRVGFELRRRESMGRMGDWLEVAPPGAGSRLVIYPKAMMPDWAERKPSIVFECADCRAAHARLRDAEVEFSSEPQSMAWGTFAIFRDPDGNEFGLKGP